MRAMRGHTLTMTYGDRVRRARLHAGLNQDDFAVEVGVDRSLIGRHEQLDEPPTRNRRALAAMIQLRYGVDADWLLTGESPQPVKAEGDLVAGAGFEPATSGLTGQACRWCRAHDCEPDCWCDCHWPSAARASELALVA